MKLELLALHLLSAIAMCGAQSGTPDGRMQAEYYVASYAKHYRVPLALVRAIVERESNWQVCSVSPKAAIGLTQLMPLTAQWLGVTDRCNPAQNTSGGVRYLASLMQRFHNDLRLVAAAYYVGEGKIGRRGLHYRNADVFLYVSRIRTGYLREAGIETSAQKIHEKRDVR
jgi:soluble lytic murein transglycosylase-like protein